MSTPREGLISEHIKAQTQLVYFLLGLAASAIAFAMHETAGAALKDTPWLIGAAVALWALSFAMGCFSVMARQRAIVTNLAFLEATKGLTGAIIDEKLSSVKKAAQDAINRPFKFFDLQLWTLFAGALFYICGHVIQMAATPSKVVSAVPEVKLTPKHDQQVSSAPF